MLCMLLLTTTTDYLCCVCYNLMTTSVIISDGRKSSRCSLRIRGRFVGTCTWVVDSCFRIDNFQFALFSALSKMQKSLISFFVKE